MFCSQCGKKVTDSMVFCPFCGTRLEVPERDGDAAEKASAPAETAQTKPSAFDEIHLDLPENDRQDLSREFEPLNLSIDWSREEVSPLLDPDLLDSPEDLEDGEDVSENFEPLDLEQIEKESPDEPAPKEGPKQDISGEISELLSSQLREEPVRLQGRVPNLTGVRNPERSGSGTRKKANTYAPVKAFNPDDMFLDGPDEDEYDDEDDGEYSYEDPEEGGFFVRHIRGVVALALFLIVLAIVAGWALSDAGQTTLAQANLAWRPQIYEKLGYQAYQNGQYVLAADYYGKALQRDDDSFNYAYSAGVAYYMGGDTGRAAEMGKRAIEISSSRVEGYQLLQRLYPDPSNRPWEIQQLLQQGYQLTGEASLNDAEQ